MNVLVGCERSGVVRDAFISAGHNAWSCDLVDTEVPGPHLALVFVAGLMACGIPKISLENPVGCIGTRISAL